HVDIETLKARLNDDEADPEFLYQIDWKSKQVVNTFNKVATALLRQQNDWIIINGDDKSEAATHFCHEVLQAMQTALERSKAESGKAESQNIKEAARFEPVAVPKTLINVDDTEIEKSDYHKALADKQAHLAKLLRARQGRHVVFAFE